MSSLQEVATYRDALRLFGRDAQLDQVVEELAECLVAVNHFKRGRIGLDKVADEVADALIMLEQAAIMVGPGLVAERRLWKLDRLRARIQERVDAANVYAEGGAA